MCIHLSGKFSPLNYLFHNKQIRPTTSERIIQISARQELKKKTCQQQEGTNHKLPQADKGLHQKVSGDVFRHYNSGR